MAGSGNYMTAYYPSQPVLPGMPGHAGLGVNLSLKQRPPIAAMSPAMLVEARRQRQQRGQDLNRRLRAAALKQQFKPDAGTLTYGGVGLLFGLLLGKMLFGAKKPGPV